MPAVPPNPQQQMNQRSLASMLGYSGGQDDGFDAFIGPRPNDAAGLPAGVAPPNPIGPPPFGVFQPLPIYQTVPTEDPLPWPLPPSFPPLGNNGPKPSMPYGTPYSPM